jgi:signal recognition particle subunit SRP54
MLEGNVTLDDFLSQVRMIKQMGSLNDLVDKMPGMAGMIPPGTNLDDKELDKVEAMILSMTKQERRDAYVMVREPERVKRISKGSGRKPDEIQALLQQYMMMKQMMDMMSGGGGGMLNSLLGSLPGGKNLQMANAMRKMAKSGGGMPGMGGGFPGMPGMGGFPGMPGMAGLPGFGMPGGLGGMPQKPSMTKMKPLSDAEKNAKKRQRKNERDARKKARK